MGGPDTGKTTLCRTLWKSLHGNTGYLDADPGQSVIGPPTTLGLKIKKEYLRFIGTTSPSYNMQPTFDSLAHLGKTAKRKRNITVADSSGFAEGEAGHYFQRRCITALLPNLIVAIQRQEELEPLLGRIAKDGRPIIRIKPDPEVLGKSRTERKDYREDRYRDYFKDAAVVRIDLPKVKLVGNIPDWDNTADYRYLLAALCSRHMLVQSLGTLIQLDSDEKHLYLNAAPADFGKPKNLIFGRTYLDIKTGKELGHR